MSNRVSKHGELINQSIRATISKRYHAITKSVNKEFWNSESEISNSIYVGSYGRRTAIDTSDIDMLMELPENIYERYDYVKGNGQSRLLQAVKSPIRSIYPNTDIHADGQVIVLRFSDGMKIEVVPAFKKEQCYPIQQTIYVYPDSNNGGNWKSTNPRAEQDAMREKNRSSNGLLMDTCKHIRRIRDDNYSSYHLSGIVIDSFVYHAIGNWRWITSESDGEPAEPFVYEKRLLDYYYYNRWSSLTAPGSSQIVNSDDYFVLEKILKHMVE